MQGIHLREYGVGTTISFELFEADGVNFRVDAAHASGDSALTKDEAAEANTTNAFADEGNGYSIVLTAEEMQAKRIVIYLVDQTATKVWLDKSIVIETYGHASAQHAFNLNKAFGAQTLTEGYAADGVEPTQEQILYMMWSLLSSLGFVAETGTARKLDGATPAMTFTVDDATTPTDINRTT